MHEEIKAKLNVVISAVDLEIPVLRLPATVFVWDDAFHSFISFNAWNGKGQSGFYNYKNVVTTDELKRV